MINILQIKKRDPRRQLKNFIDDDYIQFGMVTVLKMSLRDRKSRSLQA